MLWKRILQMFALPATNLLRLEIYGLIARFFDFYFGLNDTSKTPVIHKDLRFDANFFKILQVMNKLIKVIQLTYNYISEWSSK